MDTQSTKKSVYKRWWFWGIIGILFLLVLGSSNSSSQTAESVSEIAATDTSTTAFASSTPTYSQSKATPHVSTTEASAQPVAAWHVAFTYTSTLNDVANGGSVNTDPFTLKGSRQKILLTCSPIFNINIGSSVAGNITGDNGFDIWGNNVQCPTTANYNEYLDPGQYHLSLEFTNATSTITVEDYY